MRTRRAQQTARARIRRALLLLYLCWLLATGPEHAPAERSFVPRRRTRGGHREPVLAARREEDPPLSRRTVRAARRR